MKLKLVNSSAHFYLGILHFLVLQDILISVKFVFAVLKSEHISQKTRTGISFPWIHAAVLVITACFFSSLWLTLKHWFLLIIENACILTKQSEFAEQKLWLCVHWVFTVALFYMNCVHPYTWNLFFFLAGGVFFLFFWSYFFWLLIFLQSHGHSTSSLLKSVRSTVCNRWSCLSLLLFVCSSLIVSFFFFNLKFFS